MRFTALSPQDRVVARVFAGISLVLLVGLVASGIWLLLFNEPPIDADRFLVNRQARAPRQGVEDVHGTLGELTALVGLLAVAWWSYRVITEVSWRGVLAIALAVVGVVTGTTIAIDAVVRDGSVVPDIEGYGPLLTGNFDYVAVGSRDLGSLTLRILIFIHLVALPLIIAMMLRGRRRNSNGSASGTSGSASWLDHLDSRAPSDVRKST